MKGLLLCLCFKMRAVFDIFFKIKLEQNIFKIPALTVVKLRQFCRLLPCQSYNNDFETLWYKGAINYICRKFIM